MLGAGLHEPQKSVAGVPALIRTGTRGDLPAGNRAADIVLRAVGVERDLRVFQHREQIVFLGAEACQQAVESGKARLRGKDGVESSSLWMRRSARTQHSACSPILNWPAPSETTAVPSRSPCSAIAPQSAPSVAIWTDRACP